MSTFGDGTFKQELLEDTVDRFINLWDNII